MIMVRELKKILEDAGDNAEVVVKNSVDPEKCVFHLISARNESIYSRLGDKEYTSNDGKPYTYTKAEYIERVVLVI